MNRVRKYWESKREQEREWEERRGKKEEEEEKNTEFEGVTEDSGIVGAFYGPGRKGQEGGFEDLCEQKYTNSIFMSQWDLRWEGVGR